MSELLKIFEFTAEQAHRLAAEQSVTEEPIVIGEVTVIPVSKLSCGFTGGGSDLASAKRSGNIAAGANVSVKKTPLSFLAVCGSEVQVLHVSQEDAKKKGVVNALKPLLAQLKERAAGKKAAKVAAEVALEENGAAE